MKKYISTISIVPVLVLLVSSTLTLADWSPGDDYKMHSPQLPNPNGWDICLIHQPIADDFKCSQSGPITDIHFWVSWKDNVANFRAVEWQVSIHSDMAGQPGINLWTLDPNRTDISSRPYGTGDQGWHCPRNSLTISHDHTNIYQVNITKISKPCNQTKGNKYWLVIQAKMGTSTAEVGWKTSTSSYFGKAVYQTAIGGWVPIGTKDDDLAFVITGGYPVEVDEISMSRPGTEIITPIGKEKLTVSGPLTWKVFFEGPNEGDAFDDEGDGRDEVALEIVDLDWTDTGPLLGPIKLREHPTLTSTGLIEEQANNTAGKLDVPPFTPAGMAVLSLDFYFEIEFDGQVLYTNQPSRKSAVITHKPPGPTNPFSIDDRYLPLLNADGSISRCYFGLGPEHWRPFWEVDPFEFSRAQIQILKSGVIETVELTGFSSMYTKFDGTGEGQADDDDGDGRDEVVTEMAALDLSGTGPTLGPVSMRLRPGIRSVGEMEEWVNNTEGILDVPPFALLEGCVQSFFDVFFEVEIDGQVYHNVQPLRWITTIYHKPPTYEFYESTVDVLLFDENGNPSIYSLGKNTHYKPGYCGDDAHPIPIGDFNHDCIVNLFDLAIFATHWLECTRDICP
jgi:hypothetical protein